jgi:hypothetical protein
MGTHVLVSYPDGGHEYGIVVDYHEVQEGEWLVLVDFRMHPPLWFFEADLEEAK